MSREIPLDVNRVGYPEEVFRCILSGAAYQQCRDWGFPIPSGLAEFVAANDPDAGFDWERRLMEAASEMPVELLEKWVAAMRSGLCRAEMRALLKARKTK